ncbi:hypothetical protein [Metabacillus sp. 84]|uniref:hypothetical protein n=1 Tax=unclassified Metabacillus TaxID=2675274 RepID=UPI003CEA3933
MITILIRISNRHSIILYKVKKAVRETKKRGITIPLTIPAISQMIGFSEENILEAMELGQDPAAVS